MNVFQRIQLGFAYIVTKVEKWAPMLLVAVTFAMAWVLISQFRLSQEQSRDNDRDIAQICVNSWQGRGEIRQLVIDAAKGTASASNLAILNTVRAVSDNPDMITPELEQILRENTEEAVEPVVEGIVAAYPDPTCDLKEARKVLEETR